MAKLGYESENEVDFNNSPVSDHSSESEEEQKMDEVKVEETKKEDVIEVNPKKKRVLSEKQMAALQRGREKKLKMNLQNKKQRMEKTEKKLEALPSEEDDKENEPPVEAHKLKRTHRMDKKDKKRKVPTPPPSSEDDSEIETDEEVERSDELDTDAIIEKYLENHMKKQAARERQLKLRPSAPVRTYQPNCMFL